MTEEKPDSGSTQSTDAKSEVAQPSQAVSTENQLESHATPELPKKGQEHFVVGIGASAGGLEALEELVKGIEEINAAIVVVQHLSPRHASALTQLLARSSKLEIATALDGAPLQPNHIYVIPPNADLSIMNGILHITTPAGGQSPHFAIDYFFRSLAEDQGPCAIGIILSGTGTDGTFGLTAIKAAGGITFVQDPASAKYDGMPRSALASGRSGLLSRRPSEIGRRACTHQQISPPETAASILPSGGRRQWRSFSSSSARSSETI